MPNPVQPPERCSRKDCISPAKWQPGWRAWAQGYPRTPQFEIVAFMGLGLCDAHKADTTVKDLVSEQGAAMVNAELRVLRRVPLDFKNAEAVFHPIDRGWKNPGNNDVTRG